MTFPASGIELSVQQIVREQNVKSETMFDQMKAAVLNKHLQWIIIAFKLKKDENKKTVVDREISTLSVEEVN